MNQLDYAIDQFKKTAASQEVKGIAKYGKPLDPLEDRDWLSMANEELVDAYKYLIAEQVKRHHITRKIRELLLIESSWARYEINALLDELEGCR